jgi:hypothetical protein
VTVAVGKTYDVAVAGELTADDRAALNRTGAKVFEHAFSVLVPDRGEDKAAVARADVPSWREIPHQVIRVTAESADDARQEVIDAMGRQPPNLTVLG